MKAAQRENQTNIYLKRIEQLLLNNSNVPRTPEDIESRRNELGFFKDDITGNQLDDPETYLVSGKFFTNLRFAHIIQEDNPVIIIETVQQAKYRLLSKNKRDGETERRRDEEAETKKEPPYFSAIYCDGIVKQYRLKIIKVYEYGQRKIKNPELFLETNIIGTQVLLESALKNKIQRFHHISTDEVFGALELNTTEKFNLLTPYNPHSPYSASKAASDHLVRAYGTTYGLPYTITNCSNNYGEYQFPEKFISLTITNLIEKKNIPVYGDGLYVRDWLYVQDHCSAIDRVLTDGKLHETYLIGGLTTDVSNLEISKMILKIMGESEDKIEYVKDRPGHDRRYAVDWTKINQELGWKPSVSLEEGIKKTIEWYKNNPSWWQKLKYANKQYFSEQYQK